MRPLRSCDFCDADAAGTFEIVPPELEPTEAEQRRVVLCADCKPRLERLLEPLLARAGVDAESAVDSGSRTVVAAANESTEKRNRTTSPNAIVSESDAASGAGERSAATGSDAGPLLEDGITFDDEDGTEGATETESDARSEPAPETDASTATDPDDGPESETATSNDETAADDDSSATAASTDEKSTDEPADEGSDAAARPPNAYAKVVRLLRNREFPMQRSAVEELAAGAYDLEDHEAEAIIDHALEQDEFVERGGELRRP